MTTARVPDVQLPRPGEVIAGKYRIESIVGTGGMGVVMGAADVSLGRPVAIKFLSPQKLSRPGARERFEREARAAAQIQSEHVARVYEIGTTPNGAPFIVMEHLRGGDLSQILQQRGGLGIDEAVDYVLQACEALGEAHARGIVHRDLKPQNLFLTTRPDGSPCVKVLDFGISKALEETEQNLTSTDMVMGTPLYMSPEQVRSLKNVDQRSDIWALGSILFELLTASPVFEAPSMSALCAMIATDPPVPLRARRPQAPPELEALILRCLHKDPAGRFHDVAALADALTPFASPRGRDSAMRVSRVVRAGSPHVALAGSVPPMAAAQMATSGTTMSGAHGAAPTFASYPSHLPPQPGAHHAPTTQQTWQQQPTGSMVPPQHAPAKSGGSGLVIALALLASLVLAAGAGGVLYWRAHQEPTTPVATTSAAPTANTPGGATPGPVTSTTADSKPGGAKTATPPGPVPKPNDAKDAGAAPATDAGTPKVVTDAGGGGSPNADAERNRQLAAMNQAQCDNHTRQMTTFARTEADRKKAATQAKTFMCRGMVSTSCERTVCLNACMALNDTPCIQQVKYVIDHGPKPPY